MRPIEILLVIAVLLEAVVLFRTQYVRVVGDATDPDEEHRLFPAATPAVRPLCRSGGSDCLILPTPDVD